MFLWETALKKSTFPQNETFAGAYLTPSKIDFSSGSQTLEHLLGKCYFRKQGVVGSFPSAVERAQQHTLEQVVHALTPQIQEQIEQIVTFLFLRLWKVQIPSVDESASTVYNQVRQEQIADEQETF